MSRADEDLAARIPVGGDGLPGGGDGLLGVVLAGGGSRRFGSHKALASFRGEPLWRRASRVLGEAGLPVLILANHPQVAGAVTVPVRADLRPERGPLAGIETGLTEASERGLEGIVVLACDLVLVDAAMIGALRKAWSGAGVVAFEAPGPWGASPLCAVWGLDVLPAVTDALDSGHGSPGALMSDLPLDLVSLLEVAPAADPGRVFQSVNRPEDLDELEAGPS